MSVFAYFYPGQLLFLCPASCPSYATLSQAGLLEIPVSYLGSFGYFPARGPVLPNGYPSEKVMLMGGPEYVAYLTWFHTLSVCTLPPQRCRLSTGVRTAHDREQVHNHNLDSVALNYPCL
jgi:hypothetical protein